MEQLSLNLTIEEIKTILKGLEELPYKQTNHLIDKIQLQMEAQTRNNQNLDR